MAVDVFPPDLDEQQLSARAVNLWCRTITSMGVLTLARVAVALLAMGRLKGDATGICGWGVAPVAVCWVVAVLPVAPCVLPFVATTLYHCAIREVAKT